MARMATKTWEMARPRPRASIQEVVLAQARLRWKQCKHVLSLVQGVAPRDVLQLFKQQAAEAKSALDRATPPGERLAALLESEKAKEGRAQKLTEQYEAAQAAVCTMGARLAAARASLTDTRHLIDRARHDASEEAAQQSSGAVKVISETGQSYVDKVVDMATASDMLLELELVKQRITEKVAAAATAAAAASPVPAANGAETPGPCSAAAVSPSPSPSRQPARGGQADDAKRSRLDGKDETMPEAVASAAGTASHVSSDTLA